MMKKLIILSFLVSFMSSCKKESLPQESSEWKGTTFVRVEVVNKDGLNSYSEVTKTNIK